MSQRIGAVAFVLLLCILGSVAYNIVVSGQLLPGIVAWVQKVMR